MNPFALSKNLSLYESRIIFFSRGELDKPKGKPEKVPSDFPGFPQGSSSDPDLILFDRSIRYIRFGNRGMAKGNVGFGNPRMS